MEYEEIMKGFKSLPDTVIAALTLFLLRESLERKIWREDGLGLGEVVQKVIQKWVAEGRPKR